jgi:hypothetical protein
MKISLNGKFLRSEMSSTYSLSKYLEGDERNVQVRSHGCRFYRLIDTHSRLCSIDRRCYYWISLFKYDRRDDFEGLSGFQLAQAI